MDGKAAVGTDLKAFDRDMRSEQFLGETKTDTKGAYEISYSATQFARAEKDLADLQIKVLDANGDFIVATETIFNSEPDQIINLTLQPGQGYTSSEYERYLAALKSLLVRVSLDALTDEGLQFLVGETSLPFNHLNYPRLDAQWQIQYDVEAAVFYCIINAGFTE